MDERLAAPALQPFGQSRAAPPLWIAFGLAMGPAVALGLARFAYALILPAMRADLGWSYALAGAMNTANAIGYLAGASIAAELARRFGNRAGFLGGLVVTAMTLLASAFTSDFLLLLGLRLLAGIAGAVSFVAGAGLAAHAGAGGGPARAGLMLGIYFGGGGVGIVVSALAVPLFAGERPADWPMGWLALAAAAVVGVALAVPAVAALPSTAGAARIGAGAWSPLRLAPIFAAYGLFGAGYIAYMTFIVAFLRKEGLTAAEISAFWAILGLAGIATSFVWGPILAHFRAGRGVALVLAVLIIGASLPLFFASVAAAIGSALLFGGSFLAVVTAVTALARQAVPPAAWTRAIGALTVSFALGQCVGPVLAGILSDGPKGVQAGLALSALVLVAGAAIALLQRDHVRSACAAAD